MPFFEVVPWILLGAAAIGALASIGVVARSLRSDEPKPEEDFDCRESALIISGEGARKDCN